MNHGGAGGPIEIAILAKAARAGFVKTRLGVAIGPGRAAVVHRWLTERQLRSLPPGWPVTVHFAPADAGREMRDWLGTTVRLVPQVEGDLGSRMAVVIEQTLGRGASGIVVLGSDCPGLGADDLEAAHARLDDGADVVFGPARDGGFYLLALRRPLSAVLAAVPWSHPDTLEIALTNARKLGLRAALLDVREDVDDLESLRRAVEAGLVPASLLG